MVQGEEQMRKQQRVQAVELEWEQVGEWAWGSKVSGR